MKKTLFVLSALFLFSCNGNDDILSNSPADKNLESSTKANMFATGTRIGNDIELKDITDIAPIKSESPNYTFEFTKQLDFAGNEKKTSVLTGVDEAGKIYYSTQNDGVVDFIVQPVEEGDYSDVLYLDGDGNKMFRLKLAVNATKTGVDVIFLESYTKMDAAVARQKWSQCFSASAGSALGVSGAVVSGFTGPWGVAGWYAGIAAYCALV
ncbi:hypothetical protein ACP3T3_01950 [Chryseobacterium sp. CBSDS_008]|uniref:hypothetical protein n=1 Tax=Chryseobacterium sp. CBSDS_008 TaxID=3415265 RepID=UPI003CEB91A1